MLVKNCLKCGKEFSAPSQYKLNKRKYCSRICMNTREFQKIGQEKPCLTCSKLFYVLPSRQNNNKGIFCSLKCSGINQRKRKSTICEICHKSFEHKISQVNPRCCSRKCQFILLTKIERSHNFYDKATNEEKLQRLKESFEKYVIRKDGCWDWNGYKNDEGYVSFGYNRKNVQGHRMSWLIHYGDIPNNLLVCHKCDNPACTNPEHLFLGTPKDNNTDRKIKGRNRNQQGINNNNSKLTEQQVKEIKELLNKKKLFQREIAEKFNVSPTTISSINSNKRYKNIKN